MARSIPAALITSLRQHLHLVIIAIVYSVSVYAVSRIYDLEQLYSWMIDPRLSLLALTVSGFFLFTGNALYMPIVERERLPLTRMAGAIRTFFTTPEHWISFLLVFVIFLVFSSAFTSFKMMIPHINPYSFDQAFMELDRAIHFGIDPWRMTHAIFGSATATVFMALVYVLWFFVMWAVFMWRMIGYDHEDERNQFLTCYFIAWIVIGTFGALGFSSGGPVYYGDLVAAVNPFEELMANIHTIQNNLVAEGGFWQIWTVNAQELLWSKYVSEEPGIGAGISAMPSMHVAISVLLALTVWQRSRFFGWILIAYAILIQISAVHVGWHYAIDGYVAAILMVVIWKIVGRFTTR